MALPKLPVGQNTPNQDTGFGNTGYGNADRFLNRDGTFNISREGLPYLNRISVYNFLLSLSLFQFLLVTLFTILLWNIFFTALYVLIGFDHFQGFVTQGSWQQTKELFYFSAQTFTTVGYGRINPTGDATNIIASLEAVTGFLSFAFITGLIYGRFAKPKANLQFSKNAVVALYRGITGLMFRFAASKNSHNLSDVMVKVNLGMMVEEGGRQEYRFFDLQLERTHVESLPMNFTVVHPIDEQSPLWKFTAADYEKADTEFYVIVRAFDDVYSATVQQRTSYIYSEILHGRKFAPMYRESGDGRTTVLEMQHLNKTIPAG